MISTIVGLPFYFFRQLISMQSKQSWLRNSQFIKRCTTRIVNNIRIITLTSISAVNDFAKISDF